jgi:hypothetical protein
LSRYGYTHRELYRRTPYDELHRLVAEVREIEREIAEARKET